MDTRNSTTELHTVYVKYGDDGEVTRVAQHVDLAAASTIAAKYKTATRFIISELSDTVVATYRPTLLGVEREQYEVQS